MGGWGDPLGEGGAILEQDEASRQDRGHFRAEFYHHSLGNQRGYLQGNRDVAENVFTYKSRVLSLKLK